MKHIIFSLMLLFSINSYAQSLYNLESNPTFKGITIGMSVKDSAIASKIKYIKTSDDLQIYEITDRNFYSIFNTKVDSAHISVKDERIYSIELTIVKKGEVDLKQAFNTLDYIKNKLAGQWGNPNFTKNKIVCKKFTRLVYFYWESKTKKCEWYVDYYGAFEGYNLVFTIKEHKIDF